MALVLSRDTQLASFKEALGHIAGALNAKFSVELWDGSLVPMGTEVHSGLVLAIKGPGTLGMLLRWPTLETVVRLYATGQFEIKGGSLIEFCEAARVPKSRERLKQLKTGLLLKTAFSFLFARAEKPEVKHAYPGDEVARGTCPRNNRDYIQFHYDLGNDFYELFLDSGMQYSCGYFQDWSNSLEQAQHDKLEMICRKLRLKPGEKLLDIGCGWGGLVCHAARHYGVRAHGVTLSQAQYDYANEKIRRLDLADRVTIELRDYTTVNGKYDKIASIGMYEHVGIANYPAYFGKIYSLLRDRGILLNHGITLAAKPTRRGFKRIRPEQ